MKAVVQRVRGLTKIDYVVPETNEKHVGEFNGVGLVVLLGWLKSDLENPRETETLVAKEQWIKTRVQGMRIFPDADERMNLNLEDYLKVNPGNSGGILWVPQFTLAGELNSGFRPSFIGALDPEIARDRFKKFTGALRMERQSYKQTYGCFGTDMDIQFTAWGPVTIQLEV